MIACGDIVRFVYRIRRKSTYFIFHYNAPCVKRMSNLPEWIVFMPEYFLSASIDPPLEKRHIRGCIISRKYYNISAPKKLVFSEKILIM